MQNVDISINGEHYYSGTMNYDLSLGSLPDGTNQLKGNFSKHIYRVDKLWLNNLCNGLIDPRNAGMYLKNYYPNSEGILADMPTNDFAKNNKLLVDLKLDNTNSFNGIIHYNSNHELYKQTKNEKTLYYESWIKYLEYLFWGTSSSESLESTPITDHEVTLPFISFLSQGHIDTFRHLYNVNTIIEITDCHIDRLDKKCISACVSKFSRYKNPEDHTTVIYKTIVKGNFDPYFVLKDDSILECEFIKDDLKYGEISCQLGYGRIKNYTGQDQKIRYVEIKKAEITYYQSNSQSQNIRITIEQKTLENNIQNNNENNTQNNAYFYHFEPLHLDRILPIDPSIAKEKSEKFWHTQINFHRSFLHNTKMKAKKMSTLLPTNSIDALYGLDDLKALINTYKDIADPVFNEELKMQGMTQEVIFPHLILKGNPGTGKTTIARCLANDLKKCNLLRNGKVYEHDRASLVGPYMGQTEDIVKRKLEEAKGSIFFIDEAYTLTSNSSDSDYGKRVIDVLINFIENNREDIVIILAGYCNEMDTFLKSNPGLSSRFQVFDVEDPTLDVLVNIFISLARKDSIKIDPTSYEHLEKTLSNLKSWDNPSQNSFPFGNIRGVREYYETVKLLLLKRVNTNWKTQGTFELSIDLQDLNDAYNQFKKLKSLTPPTPKGSIGFTV